LAFTVCDDNSLLLASAAQDNYVRLWKFSTLNALNQSLGADSSSFGLFSSQNAVAQHRAVAVEKARSTQCDTLSSTPLGSRGHLICVHRYLGTEIQSQEFAVILDAVLSGHEDWVFSVRWHPRMQRADGTTYQPLCLLTASMDKSMMIWRPDPNSSLWLNDVRVGEVGGHTLGLFGGVFGPQGRAILAHGYNGAFHLWRNSTDTGSPFLLCLSMLTVWYDVGCSS
jgi:elongator complex protein 2